MYRESDYRESETYREPEATTAEEGTAQLPAVRSENPSARRNPAPADLAGVVAGARRTEGKRRGVGKRALIGAAIVVALVAGGIFGVRWWLNSRYFVSTDDAYVSAHNTTLASKISGYVARIAVPDNARVRAGDVIAVIDDGDYRLAVDAARGKVATQQATVDRIGRQVVAQGATIDQAKAQMLSAQAAAKRTQLELERQRALVAKNDASQQALEQAVANRDQAVAGVQSAQAVVAAAVANLDVLKAQQQEAMRTLDELNTALAKAERDLSFTVLRAPVDGVFSNRAVQTGDYVQTGQRIGSLVPLDGVYIEANFKETQLERLRPGQPVSISVDALPQHAIHGVVASLAPASGAVFSLLPPDNATGNFTKIVQRLPVRIDVPPSVAAQRLLRPGMSVVVSVDTRSETSSPRTAKEARAAAPPNGSSTAED